MPGMKGTNGDRNEYRRAWRARNKDKCRAQERRWRERHPEKQAAAMRRNYLKHRDERLNKARKRRLRQDVQERTRDQKFQSMYGFSLAAYNELFAFQGGVCAACYRPEPKRRLAVDHNHQTGQVRGLLCSSCNLALGHLSESMERLQKLAKYLELHDGWNG